MVVANEEQLSKVLDVTPRRIREIFKGKRLENGNYPLIPCFMEFIKQSKSGGLDQVTQKTVSEILGISERTVKTLTDKGILSLEENGKYDLKKIVKEYIQSQSEWAKKQKIDRETAEVKLKALKNEYHKNEDVQFILSDMLINFKSKLNSLARKIDNGVDKVPEKDRFDFINGLIQESLLELAKYKVFKTEKGSKSE